MKHAVAAEKWLESDRTKYMSPLYRHQYFQNKKRLEKYEKFKKNQKNNKMTDDDKCIIYK